MTSFISCHLNNANWFIDLGVFKKNVLNSSTLLRLYSPGKHSQTQRTFLVILCFRLGDLAISVLKSKLFVFEKSNKLAS